MLPVQILRTILSLAAIGFATTVAAEPPSRLPGDRSLPESFGVATIAMHSDVGNPAVNLQRFEFWCRKASAAGAKFAVFPEECLTGSLNKSTLTRQECARIARETQPLALKKVPEVCRQLGLTVVVGLIEPGSDKDKFRNSALIVSPSKQLVMFTKLWLPNRNESTWFEAGRELPVVTSQGWTFSVGICADIDRPEYFHAAFQNGADFMLLPIGGSGGAELVGTDGDQRKQANYHKGLHLPFLSERARETGMYLFYANQAGRSGTDWFPGLALAIDPNGRLVDEHTPTEGMTVTMVSRAAIAAARRRVSSNVAAGRPPLKLANSAGESVRIKLVGETAAAPP